MPDLEKNSIIAHYAHMVRTTRYTKQGSERELYTKMYHGDKSNINKFAVSTSSQKINTILTEGHALQTLSSVQLEHCTLSSPTPLMSLLFSHNNGTYEGSYEN
jgi:hypothetical protein